MDREKIALTGAQETMLATLYGRAIESRSPHPILGDREAEKAVARIDYDFARLKIRRREGMSVALRAKSVDRWVEEYLDAHHDGTVLHLGCGLDTRAHRVDPPPSVQWYDVDYPDVIDLRRRLYPEREGHHTIGSSVTDPHLLDTIPGDGPVLVVAEGLTMYLSTQDGVRLLRRITEHFPSGELVFDALSHWGVWLTQRFQPAVKASGARLEWSIDDPRELERVVPGLVLDTEWSYADAPEITRYPWPTQKILRLMGHVTALRRVGRLLRYRFGQETR
jgi:O-methyltransferase involved in polyketide biosynthesis